MDDVQENLGALVVHYVLVACQVLALGWNLDYTYAENAGHFPEMVVWVVMSCYRRLVAFFQFCVLNPQWASQQFQREMVFSYNLLKDLDNSLYRTQKMDIAQLGWAEVQHPVVA